MVLHNQKEKQPISNRPKGLLLRCTTNSLARSSISTRLCFLHTYVSLLSLQSNHKTYALPLPPLFFWKSLFQPPSAFMPEGYILLSTKIGTAPTEVWLQKSYKSKVGKITSSARHWICRCQLMPRSRPAFRYSQREHALPALPVSYLLFLFVMASNGFEPYQNHNALKLWILNMHYFLFRSKSPKSNHAFF